VLRSHFCLETPSKWTGQDYSIVYTRLSIVDVLNSKSITFCSGTLL
ncbi:hypothetical protein GBAR_LOCUS3254, partial [Geodia barretti]